jgi:predicted RNase H-like HicB family nuclease
MKQTVEAFQSIRQHVAAQQPGKKGLPPVSTVAIFSPMRYEARDYGIHIWYSAEPGDECYVAQVEEWPGIMAHGDSPDEAAREIQVALNAALRVAVEEGLHIPEPRMAHA